MAKNLSQAIDFYDDQNYDYEDFWVGRDYEHNAEVIALSKLLKGRHFKLAMDYGGGYGRLSPIILEHCDRLLLADPSVKQLNIGRRFLKDYANVDFVKILKNNKIPADDGSLELLVMIRVSHHLIDPKPTFKDIYRVLDAEGMAIIEIANEAHMINRLRYLKQLKQVPLTPVPIGQKANGIEVDSPFVNHNPKTIERLFADVKLRPVAKLSVSNLRHPVIKRLLPQPIMLKVERAGQAGLAKLNFGPSMFYLVKKV